MENTGFRAIRRKHKVRLIITLISLSAFGGIVYTALTHGVDLFRKRVEILRPPASVEELWKAGLYLELIETAENILLRNPLDTNALLYAGFARYYLALSQPNLRNQDLDIAILHLRQLLAVGNLEYPEKIAYVLGKVYLEKGIFWADLAEKYLQIAYSGGYAPEDIFEYLGRTYAILGNSDTALHWYRKASEKHPTDRLLLALGDEAYKLGYYDDAEIYYIQSITESRDDNLENRGLFQLGQLYYDVGNYLKAKEVLERLVNREKNNVDSLFLLAETCFALDLPREARQYWHAVVRLVPDHYDALKRLYG